MTPHTPTDEHGDARKKFALNDRVRPSALGLERRPQQRGRTAIVRGFSFEMPFMVRVQLDGNKSIESYHMDFWEKIDDDEGGSR